MPKYYGFKVYGYYLYFTSHCIVEAMHVHASDAKLTESGSAKFFVKADGGTRVAEKGRLSDKEVLGIQEFIKMHYKEMYLQWAELSSEGFYRG
ncbi:MAG: DUF4160 domain-containing protein [Kiritimatiellae bacterium]|nr:DUF4160 domain-containing protein [Kiritimatiellia bacterium]